MLKNGDTKIDTCWCCNGSGYEPDGIREEACWICGGAGNLTYVYEDGDWKPSARLGSSLNLVMYILALILILLAIFCL